MFSMKAQMVRHSVAVHAVGAKVVGGHNSSNTIINYLIFIKSHCQRNLVVAFLRVRPAAHVSSRCKSGVRPVVGRT